MIPKFLNDPFVILMIGLLMPVFVGLFVIFFGELKETKPRKTKVRKV